MNDRNLIRIFSHFGYREQLKKLNEECYELIEAINDYEGQKQVCMEFCSSLHCDKEKEHIKEEIADIQVLLNQFKEEYEIWDDEIVDIMERKIDRTLERIKAGYYDKFTEIEESTN